MKAVALMAFMLVLLTGCRSAAAPPQTFGFTPELPGNSKAEKNSLTVIHVLVALCDNVNQGIVPVPAALGNGDDPQKNLYWGAAYGVKTFFSRSRDWELLRVEPEPDNGQFIIQRIVFKRRDRDIFLIADAYRGREIRRATRDFFRAAAGEPGETIKLAAKGKEYLLHTGESANLMAYVGHNGLMDFSLESIPKRRDDEQRDAIMLACASKSYFGDPLRSAGAKPLLWTTNLMAPEAYVLSAAIEGWLRKETDEQIRQRAARAYNQYQHCGERAANKLFATGW